MSRFLASLLLAAFIVLCVVLIPQRTAKASDVV